MKSTGDNLILLYMFLNLVIEHNLLLIIIIIISVLHKIVFYLYRQVSGTLQTVLLTFTLCIFGFLLITYFLYILGLYIY